MTVSPAEAQQDLVAEAAKLARQMVYLEEAAAEAYERRLWTVVGDLHEQRREVQEHRSELLRIVWQFERRQRRKRDYV